jgi:hypothetical protein
MLNITQFAKVHQLDDRHAYKEAWAVWLEENQDCIEREISRLQQLEYKGDIVDKMFKAGRYYFREKVITTTEKKEKKQRDYIIMDQLVIHAMDTHLRLIMPLATFKPALAYKQFCEGHVDLLRKEISRLVQQNISGKKMTDKFKKTYKNRYFLLHQL